MEAKISVIEDMVSTLTEPTTPEEIGNLLNVDKQVIRNLCAAGKIRAIKVGRLWRIPKRFLIEYLEGGADANK